MGRLGDKESDHNCFAAFPMWEIFRSLLAICHSNFSRFRHKLERPRVRIIIGEE